MKIKEILKVTNGKLVIGNENEEVENFCKDTRTLKLGDTYIGIKGANFDGNLLWKEAIDAGAKTVIVQGINFEKYIGDYKNKNIILVDDTIKAIADIARYKRSLYDIPVIGITGSVGKTSTKDIVASVISQKYKTLKTEGNNNNNIGLPFTIFKLTNHKAAVIEMGMNHFGEISNLTKIAQPTISVITNIGTSHIGNLGSRENILKAKLEILEGMNKKVLVVNNDNDLLHNFYLKNRGNKDIEIYTYGIDNDSDVMAQNIVLNENDSKFKCSLENFFKNSTKNLDKNVLIDGEDSGNMDNVLSKKNNGTYDNETKFNVMVPVGGKHFIYNALCAITIGKILNLDTDKIINGIETFELTKKRMDITKLKNGVTIINDSYNASFESMKASMEYLSKINSKRKIAVLGDMFELGDYSVDLHKKVGKEVAMNNIDILIASGENAKFIIEEAIINGMPKENTFYFNNKDLMQDFIKNNWKDGDCFLFKASNGMKFFEIVDNLIKLN